MSAESKRRVHLQYRDLAILRGLFESRVMSLNHISLMYFEGRKEAATKRVRHLKAAGAIAEYPRQRYQPSILFLSSTGFELLQTHRLLVDHPALTWNRIRRRAYVSNQMLRHELAILDVKAALRSAAANGDGIKLVEFLTWQRLFQFKARLTNQARLSLIQPDGFIRLRQTTVGANVIDHAFFIEVDRSTESQDTLVRRAAFYVDYYRSGGYAIKQGGESSDFKHFPFRVLFILQNEERRNNLAERLLLNCPPILTQIWLTTIDAVTNNPLGPIWIRPLDYRSATIGTPFDPRNQTLALGHRRRSDRDKWIETTISKHSLTECDRQLMISSSD